METQLLCENTNVKLVWTGQRISFVRVDGALPTVNDVNEAIEMWELFHAEHSGSC